MTLTYGTPSAIAAPSQLSAIARHPFGEVLASLRKAIAAAGMKVPHETDPQGALRGTGQEIPAARLLFFFHPRLLARLLELDQSAIVEALLKLAVMELPDGPVSIRIADPAVAFARYGNPALASFGKELSAACRAIAAA